MSVALIITLRETLEASLITGIILAYLSKTNNSKHKKFVWIGVITGILLSILLTFIFNKYLGGFEGKAEEIYEGTMMIFASILLTWMILWMLTRKKNLKEKIENKLDSHVKNDNAFGIFFLILISVLREGIETVIFLQAAAIDSSANNMLLGGIIGIITAIAFSFILFKGIVKISLQKFFTFTSIILIFFAAGLVAHGVHEFEEAGLIPIYIEHLWDINPVVIQEGVYPLLHEKGTIGGFLKGLFGYNGDPSLTEVLSYIGYLLLISLIWFKLEKNPAQKN